MKLNIRNVGVRVWKFFCKVIFFLIIVELFLQLLSYLYLSAHFNKPKIRVKNTDNAITLFYVGDSWTQGADAPKGEGYADVLLNMLRTEFPHIKIQQVNLGRGSFNSAESCIEFLRNYKQINPDILIVLFGMNDVWNTSDVDLAEKYFEREMQGIKCNTITFRDILFSRLEKLKIFNLLRITWVNLIIRNTKFDGPHPMNSYVSYYFTYHGQGKIEQGRDYLINNCNEPSKYDDLYRIFLYSFNYDRNAVEAYLKKKNFWHPEWIKYAYDTKKRERYLNLKEALFKRHIACLLNICKKENITLIMQTYPFFNNDWCDYLNEEIRIMAYHNGIYLVDHASLFRKDLGDNYHKYQNNDSTHVNAAGHFKMAKDLLDFFIKEKLLDKAEK